MGFLRTPGVRMNFAHGLAAGLAQINVSHNLLRGTLRGMHFQARPYEEAKVVSCTLGAIYDVVIDLRPQSPTYLSWVAEELNAENRRGLYVPEGCGHGFQTLTDATQVLYFMSEFYSPQHARGIRYDDAALGIPWPLEVTCISKADLNWPRFEGSYKSAAAGRGTGTP